MPNGIKELLIDENAAWNSHDPDMIATFYTEDCIKEDIAVGAEAHGKEEMKALIRNAFTAMPDLHVELTSCFNSGEWAASEWIMSGTYARQFPGMPPGTGRKFSVRGSTIMKLRNGRISRVTDYWNFHSFLEQLGLLVDSPPS